MRARIAAAFALLALLLAAHAHADDTGRIPLVTDPAQVFVEPIVAKPDYLTPIVDPVFGGKIHRISADTGTPLAPLPRGIWSTEARHHYFADQPWNSDGTLIALQNKSDPSFLLLDGETYEPRYGRCPDYSGDDRWHPSKAHPHERITVNGSELMWFDVTQCVKTRSWTLPFPVEDFGSGTGNPSADGRFIALGDTDRVFVVDMDPQPPFAPWPAVRIGPVFRIAHCDTGGDCLASWSSVSPSGKYVVVSYNGHPRVLDVDPQTLALSSHAMPASAPRCFGEAEQGFIYDLSAVDFARNPFDGDQDVLIGQEHCGNRGKLLGSELVGGVVMVRLADGAVSSLTDPTNEAYVQGVSARNDQRPGWVYVSYYQQPGKRFSDEVVAVKMDGSGEVERLAHKHSNYASCYRCTPHPVPSRDGRRVLFASNWYKDCLPCGTKKAIGTYVADFRSPDTTTTTNHPPQGTILEPADNLRLVVGDTLHLAGTATDPDGDLALTYDWELDGAAPDQYGANPDPIVLTRVGAFAITLIVRDVSGLADPTPPRRVITVSEPPVVNRAPNGTIVLPAGNVTITAGDSVVLAATGSDPDGNLPLSYHWTFAAGASDEFGDRPAPVRFLQTGTFKISLIVSDALGLADPKPATRVVYVKAAPPPPPPPPPPGGAHEVHWTISGPRAVTLDWAAGGDFVRFGRDTAYGGQVQAIVPTPKPFSSAGPFREARIDGLEPDAVYHYSIGATGPDHTFRTAPVPGSTDFDVYVAADVGSSSSYKEVPVLQSLIAADLPRFTLMVGDLSYGNAHGQKAVGIHFDDMMPWSQDAAYMPAWGNHEWDSPSSDDLRNYKGRFDLPNPQTSPGSPAVSCCSEDWYWFDYGNVRFIAYPEPWVGALADWKTRAQGLMSQAQLDPKIEFIVTFGHRPPYSSGHHPGLTSLKSIVDALGAAYPKYVLNLSGHSHDYERTNPQFGVTHLVAGGGGGGLETDSKNGCLWRGGCPAPSYVAARAMHHSVVKLHFGPDRIEGWAICGPPSAGKNDMTCTLGAPLDHFVIASRSDTSSTPAPTDSVLANLSFESSLAGIGVAGRATMARSGPGVDDDYCAEYASDTTVAFGLTDAPNLVTSTTAAGVRYRYTAWVRAASAHGKARVRVREYQGATQIASATSADTPVTGEWTQVALDYTTTRKGTALDLAVLYDPSGYESRFQVDDITASLLAPAAPALAEAAPLGRDVTKWDDDDLEDGGGAGTLGQRLAVLKFESRLFPSPFRDRSLLSFTTTRRGLARVVLYDVSGRVVRTLADESDLGPGRHEITLDGSDGRGGRLAPGLYLYRVHASEGILGGRCVILP